MVSAEQIAVEHTADTPPAREKIDGGLAWNLQGYAKALGTSPERVDQLLADQDNPAIAEELDALVAAVRRLLPQHEEGTW